MVWSVETVDEFTSEFAAFEAAVQTEIAVMVRLLEAFGPVSRRQPEAILQGTGADSRYAVRASSVRFENTGEEAMRARTP